MIKLTFHMNYNSWEEFKEVQPDLYRIVDAIIEDEETLFWEIEEGEVTECE